jgi:uncharacterized spore protein YtfJ
VAKDKQRKAKPGAAVPPPPPPDVLPGRFGTGAARLVNALGGASLVFGEPIQAHGRTVVPVARVRGAGGGGSGRGSGPEAETGDGWGGGAAVEATPAGFLDITADGVRYEAIPDPVTTARALSTGASALTLLLSAVLGVRRLGRRRAAAALLPPR